MNQDMLQAEHIRELDSECRRLRFELIKSKLKVRRLRNERDSAIGMLRIKCQDSEYEAG